METFLFPEGQLYDCVMCAKGCRQDWAVDVDSKSAKLILQSPVELRVVQETGASGLLGSEEQGWQTRKFDGRCVFLQADDLCGIHAEIGLESKPLNCREFPFTFVETPDGIVVGVSYFCTAVQQNVGRPLSEHKESLSALYRNYGSRRPRVGQDPIDFGFGFTLPWPEYQRFEDSLKLELENRTVLEALAATLLAALRALEGPPRSLCGEDLEGCRPGLGESHILSTGGDVFREQTRYFALTLVGVMEAASPQQGPGITQALMCGEQTELPVAGWAGTLEEVLKLLELGFHQPSKEWTVRYIRALLHRKIMVLHRGVLESLVMFYLASWVLEFYAAVACLKRGGVEVTFEDYAQAFDRVEGDLVTHATGFDPFYVLFTQAYAEIVGVSAK